MPNNQNKSLLKCADEARFYTVKFQRKEAQEYYTGWY